MEYGRNGCRVRVAQGARIYTAFPKLVKSHESVWETGLPHAVYAGSMTDGCKPVLPSIAWKTPGPVV